MLMQNHLSEKARLAKITGIREDVIDSLHLPPEEITGKFNAVKNGKYWNGLLGLPAELAAVVALVSTVFGDTKVLPGVGMWIGASIISHLAKSQDHRKKVKENLIEQSDLRLQALNYEAAKARTETGAALSKVIRIDEATIAAAEIPEERLNTMFNKASFADKWGTRGAVAFLGLIVASLVSFATTGPESTISNIVALTGIGSLIGGAMVYRGKEKVQKQVREAANDKLVALDRKERGQTPAPPV
ncbi:MAG: hypothetical protein H6867_11365 [Rhodospirillales bacterium]|nr:hypothetical protein [Rhodospirillales bacterium]MCB9996728.1 hypothetical protein [Rhodospirillales bacterium]